MPASDGADGAGRVAAPAPTRRRRRAPTSAPRSSSALDMRTTKAFGHELHEPRAARRRSTSPSARRAASRGTRRRSSSADVKVLVSGVRDLDLGAEHDAMSPRRPRPSSGSSPRRPRRARARTAPSRPGPRARSMPIIAAASVARALQREQEHVAAGDAVDVGRPTSRPTGPACRRTADFESSVVVTSPDRDLARRRTSRARRRTPRRSTGRAASERVGRAHDATSEPAGDLHGAAAAAAARTAACAPAPCPRTA